VFLVGAHEERSYGQISLGGSEPNSRNEMLTFTIPTIV